MEGNSSVHLQRWEDEQSEEEYQNNEENDNEQVEVGKNFELNQAKSEQRSKVSKNLSNKRGSQDSMMSMKSRISSPSELNVSIKSNRNYNKITKISDWLLEFEKLLSVWKTILWKEYGKTLPLRRSRTISQLGEEADKIVSEELLSKISPVEMMSSYLSIITNTPENSKEMIRNRLFHTLRKGSILESSQAIANISRKQSFDLSAIHKRHNSMSSQSLMRQVIISFIKFSSLNKHASNGSPSVYNNILNLKVNKGNFLTLS